MSSDYTPPRLVKPTPGGNPGDGSMDGALTIAAAIAAQSWKLSHAAIQTPNDLNLSNNGTNPFQFGDNGLLYLAGIVSTGPIYIGGILSKFNNINTAGLGLSPIYAVGSRVTVAATTSPGTTLASFTPGATGSCKVNVTIKNKDTVAVTAYVLVAYTDPDVGAQSVLIINGVSIAASGIASAHFVLDSTATDIAVSAYGSVASELVATADIEQFN